MYDETLLEQVRAGMDLCSNDYKKWADVDGVRRPPEGSQVEPYVLGHLGDGTTVYVPAGAILEIRGGRCVVFDAPLANAGAMGWGKEPEPRSI